ncbi:Sensor histidine kinase RcsC [Candidatus Magnetaquicoccaceae bacterium FCR-1]|uniref:histidine kinase n=1 Tax=Candidatus Magnetaquiglobus chichijimensis TaxID=3141448 RepID=A0ABQ0CD48_9PROT
MEGKQTQPSRSARSIAQPRATGWAWLLLLIHLLVGCQTAWADRPLTIGILDRRFSSGDSHPWQPLADYLTTHVGLSQPIELVVADYTELNRRIADGALDFLLTNPLHYIQLRQQYTLSSPLATLSVKSPRGGSSALGGVILARAGRTDLNTLADLAGKRIAAPFPESLGGYMAPMYELHEAGIRIDPERQIQFVGVYPELGITQVLEGKADVAFTRTGMLEAMLKSGKLAEGQLKVIHGQQWLEAPFISSTRLYPEWPFVAIAQQEQNHLHEQIVAALLTLGEHPFHLPEGVAGFVMPADYTLVDKVARVLKLPPFESNGPMSWNDLWSQFHGIIMTTMLAVLAIIALAIQLSIANRRLRQSETRWHALFNQAPDAIFLADAKTGLIIDANQAACRLIGKPLKALRGAHHRQLHPNDENSQTISCGFEEHARQTAIDPFLPIKTWIVNQQGMNIPVEVAGCRIDLAGQSIVQGFFRDISHIERMQQEILAREHAFRQAIETTHDGYWEVDPATGRLLDVNHAYAERSGYDREELLRMSIPDLESLEDAWDVRTHIARIERYGRDRFETWHKTKNGNLWPVEVSVSSSGPGGRMLSFARDLTLHKRDEAIILKEKELQEILAGLGKELLAFQKMTIPSLAKKVLAFCLAVTRSCQGYINEVDARTGHACNRAIIWDLPILSTMRPPILFTEYTDIWGWVIEHQRPLLLNTPQRTSHFFSLPIGHDLILDRFLAVPVMQGGRVVAEIAVGNSGRDYSHDDITALERIADLLAIALDRVKLEGQLLHASRMEAIGTLGAGIAHDFNNILGIILGFAELGQIKSADPAGVSHCLGEIAIAGNRAKGLVDQLLTFSRGNPVGRATLKLARIVREVSQFLRISVPSSIAIITDIQAEEMMIHGDGNQIHQMLLNLGTNARQAILGDRGRITFTLDQVDLTEGPLPIKALTPGHYARIQVRDTGNGIPQEVIGQIFDPFFTTKEVGKGTGLGLAVVHGIATSHGGAVTVESEWGKGCLFQLFLPMIDPARAEPEYLTEILVPIAGRGTLLIVDDEPQLLSLLEGMLSGLGYRVQPETDPYQALANFAAHADRFQAVITDYAMPGMTGVELATRIRAIRPDLPVILLTGMDSGAMQEDPERRVIDRIVYKPTPIRPLSEALNTLIRPHSGDKP